MKNYRIADRYARVLIKLAENEKQMEKIHRDVKSISGILKESPEFSEFVINPVIPVQKRKEVLERLFNHKLDSGTLRFLLLLAEKERLNELSRICEIFQKLYDELQNIVRAKVYSVCRLRPDQVTAISGKLKKHFHKDVDIETQIDKSLLGGFKVQVGDLIYDYTIRTQLEKYREAVMNH